MENKLDFIVNRRNSDSVKWHYYDPDVLPMWVADMDFECPPAVIEALQKRVDHGVFGYPMDDRELRELIAERMDIHYQWEVSPDQVLMLPGVITGFNLVCQVMANPGEGVLVQTPGYPPILSAARYAQLTRNEMELTQLADGSYEIDFDLFRSTINPQTRVFLLCNPHNPVGRVFSRSELETMAEICLENNTIICSDEIHCDLVYSGSHHIPIASLSPEIAANTVTLMAPSKTFNIAGLQCAFAIIQNQEIRARIEAGRRGLVAWVNIFGTTAARAAYQAGQAWLDEILVYLEANRDMLHRYVQEQLPGIRMGKPEGTFLAWLDCREAGIPGNPCEFFLEKGRVGLNDGRTFGKGGSGFVRMNYGCPQPTMMEGLGRLKAALDSLRV